MTDLEKPGDGRNIAIDMMSGAFAAILALPAGPIAPVIAGLTAPLIARVAVGVAAEWRRKTTVVADTAFSAGGFTDPEAFCDALTSDPGLIALTQKILFAAAVTGSDRKLRLLARCSGAPPRTADWTRLTSLSTRWPPLRTRMCS